MNAALSRTMAKVVHSQYAARKGMRWTREFVRTVEPFDSQSDLAPDHRATIKAALASGPRRAGTMPRP